MTMTLYTANLAVFSAGMHNGWPSPYIPVLERGNYTFQITSEESSYLVATPQIGEIAGAIICLLAVDIVGRKMMIIFTASLFIISWILLGLAATSTLMFASRFLEGVSCLISFATVVMYLAEITNPTARAFLVTLSASSLAIGDLVIYVIGAFIPLDTAAFICASFIFSNLLLDAGKSILLSDVEQRRTSQKVFASS